VTGASAAMNGGLLKEVAGSHAMWHYKMLGLGLGTKTPKDDHADSTKNTPRWRNER